MNGRTWPLWVSGVLLAGVGPTGGADVPPETVRYVRPIQGGFATECMFVIARHEKGWTITSRTDSGGVQLEVEARYGPQEQLTEASAVLTSAGKTTTTTVTVKDGKATVARAGQELQEFDAPRGTIVTSVPDWTDVFLLCRRYDRERQGKQEFPGLWIHPTRAPQRLTFSIERQGTDTIVHAGKKIELGRYLIRIRNNSGYAAWADAQGRLIRLLPLPMPESPAGLILEGYEQAAAGLRPPP